MAHNEDYTEKLKKCLSADDVWRLMSGRTYRGTESCFEDSGITFRPGTPGKPQIRFNFNLENDTLELALRVFVFLKLDGRLGKLPQNTGKSSVAGTMRETLTQLEKLQPKLTDTTDISEKDIRNYMQSNTEKDQRNTTFDAKLRRLIEWGTYSDLLFPPFLRFNSHTLLGLEEYSSFKKDLLLEREDNYLVGSRREPYDLREMKKLIKFSMDYIENYTEDVLFAIELYQNSLPNSYPDRPTYDWESKEYRKQKKIKNEHQYRYVYNTLKGSSHVFTEPSLKKLKHAIEATKSKHYYENKVTKNGLKSVYQGRSVSNAVKPLSDCHAVLEGCCVAIILLTTAMRGSELIALKKDPEIKADTEADERYRLSRMIYKTSASEDGEKHTIPIPEITKIAIQTLAKIANKRGIDHEMLILGGDLPRPILTADTHSLNSKIARVAELAGTKKPPTSHDFRHAMAFMVARANGQEGVELAKTLLNHDSYIMTLKYLGHYNTILKEALRERYSDESYEMVEQIASSVKNGEKLFGAKGERLMPGHQFVGSIAGEFVEFLTETLHSLIDTGKLLIIQTNLCFCMHDLTKPEEMDCQRGFNITDFTGEQPMPSRCTGGSCGNAVFTEANMEDLQPTPIDEALRERLSRNKLFIESGGFDNDPLHKLITQYQKTKEALQYGKAN